MTRRAALLAVTIATTLAGCMPPPPAAVRPLRFLSINDVYVIDTLSDGTGGLARVSTVRTRIGAEGPVLLVLAGDLLSPSLLSKYYHGRQMVATLNAAKLDYATFGNHEFELARDTLVARIAESRFKWISANCMEASGAAFPGVTSWDTLRMQGTLVGIFGLTIQEDYRPYVRCTNPDSAAHTAIDTLKTMGAKFIVALTHQSLSADQAMLRREPALDLVLGGHEHERHDALADGRHVLKADANSRSAQFRTVWGAAGAWRQAATLVTLDGRIPLDTAVQAVVEAWQDSLKARLGPETTIGTAVEPIDARDAISRNQESPIGDLVTDAMRFGTGADVALLNAGTLRLDDVIHPGPVTNYTVESLFLFADDARTVTFPLTGTRLRTLLEHGVESAGSGPFLQVSGVRFTYNPGAAAGQRIQGPLMRPDGSIIRPDETVTVAFDVYPACESGDGYHVPEAAEACRTWEQAPRGADLLRRYVQEQLGGKISVPAAGRITRAGS
jgi:5'-nucleotidase